MTAQLHLDDLDRGQPSRGRCLHCRPSPSTGIRVSGGELVILGHCELYGRDAYDRDCETCPMWRCGQ